MKTAIVGLGLIGGSYAKDLKSAGFAKTIVGVDSNTENCKIAIQNGIVDSVSSLDDALKNCDLIILAIPVDAIVKLLPEVLSKMKPGAIVSDVGSVKTPIVQSIITHPLRARFVAGHPMAGSENSGPLAAQNNLFTNKVAILCNTELNDKDALMKIEEMYGLLGARVLYMSAEQHDEHVAYVSHFSHIISFALALTVLNKEKDSDKIFDLAAGGFESTVRLAKSSPDMWSPIFLQNAENLMEITDIYIAYLQKFKECMHNKNYSELQKMMQDANRIRKVLEVRNK